MSDRAEIVHDAFLARTAADDLPSGVPPRSDIPEDVARAIFVAQCQSRALDRESRAMQKRGQGFYTIGSSGHEGMAAVAQALRPTDPAFLHYRDGAFQLARAQQAGMTSMVRDMLLSFACSSDDPISGGRHKVLGSKQLMIPPQTSTIASHLPKAVGAAFSIGLARRRPPEHRQFEDDAIVMCSFGDASANHSTALGAFNAASWAAVQSSPLPLLFVCEDNGIGISVKTPAGWIEASHRHRPGVRYMQANGLDLYETLSVAAEAAAYVRQHRKPVFLHLKTVRLYGHAGADVATSYLSREEVERDEANDPLLHSVRLLRDAGAMTAEEARATYLETCDEVRRTASEIADAPHLKSGAEVMSTILPPPRACVRRNGPTSDLRARTFGSDARTLDQPQTMAKCLNMALTDLMLAHDEIVLMGEDIGRKGGVYGVTQKLQARFGPDRVMDTLLDEQSILGLAIGMAQNGFIPIPEIQFLAYLHNAEDQMRGEAATLPFFSQGQFTNPMVVRIAGLGYQKGFGGHFHNDNSLAVLRDIPGLVIACPSSGADAARMLRESVRLAREEQRIVAFIEPIALYQTRDAMDDGDGGWTSAYPAPDQRLGLGELGVSGDGTDLAIVTYGNGHYLSQKAARHLEAEGIATRVIDLRWLAPLPEKALLEETGPCRNVLIVDECRRTGGQAEALMALFTEAGRTRVARLTADDSFIATGPAYAATLPSAEGIVSAARQLVSKP